MLVALQKKISGYTTQTVQKGRQSLTKVLQTEKVNEESNASFPDNATSNSNQQVHLETPNDLIAKVCTTMNKKLHQQVKEFINKSKTNEMGLTSLKTIS